MKRIELATTLDKTGEKRITLFYDDLRNELFIEEGGMYKPVVDTNLFLQMINKMGEELRGEIKFCCKGCERLVLVWLRTIIKNRKPLGPPPYTRNEVFMQYYWMCLNNNFGQGERTMFKGYGDYVYPVWSYEYVKSYIERMNKKYRDLGYDV